MRLVLLFLVLLAPAVASAASSERDAFVAAGETFKALAAEASGRGDVPRLSDPKTRETLAILANMSQTYGTPAFPVGDLETAMATCQIANQAMNAYRQFGFKTFVEEKLAKGELSAKSDRKAIDAVVQELMSKNAIRFQNELYPLLNFNERCLAAEMPLLTEFFEKLPPEQRTEIRIEGLRKMRASIAWRSDGGDTGARLPTGERGQPPAGARGPRAPVAGHSGCAASRPSRRAAW